MDKHDSARKRLRTSALVALALVGMCAVPGLDSGAQAAPSIGFHFIGAGGHPLTNTCYRLSGTLGQTAPGYSSSATDSIVAGFWAAAPTTGLDEIFFNSFEDC